MKVLLTGLGAAAAIACSTPAMAAVIAGQNYTFNFSGDCVDCAQRAETEFFPVTATLQVRNYVLGTEFNTSNFVRFDYAGSNLIDPFSILEDPLNDFSGSLGSEPGSATLAIFGLTHYFRSSGGGNLDGHWETGFIPQIDDFGGRGFWSIASSSAVPEPASWAMMLFGFAIMGAALRRRQTVRVSFS